ncbi:disulfide oxidoreductase [Bacillus alkalicellulosilyticus]|uniref:disulfide oxidoreductase n=1 Tax=Alkalihalobacterium alkalicellulosilyticum TaxID=1912214 RepID=UPI0009971E82|nr:disulfide oxidoreductase [Bacillus alkalicellulosilyticus]
MGKSVQKRIESLLFSAWAISVIATSGSLYFSEIVGFIPCELCWYQRIIMYPLVIILGVAVVKKDTKQALYGLIFSTIGIIVATYHYMLQKIPALSTIDSCGIIPCTGQYINWLGFITIPFLALVAFLLIFMLCYYIIVIEKRTGGSH